MAKMGPRLGALLAAALLSPAAAELPPGLAASWQGSVTCHYPWGGSDTASKWLMDLRPERPRYKQLYSMPSITLGTKLYYPWEVLQENVLSGNPPDVTYGFPGDSTCAPSSWPVVNNTNLFVEGVRTPGLNWMAGPKITVEGRPCQTWGTPKSGWWVCVADDGSPLLYSMYPRFNCTISSIKLGPIADEHFAPSEACRAYPSPPCPNKGAVSLTLYRLHSGAEPLELGNRDLADIQGAPSIICDWYTSGQSYVTSFAVTANASWGQYGRCHYNGTNYCDAQTGNFVGRQSPQGLPGVPRQGQCSANTRRGSWFSFPAGGECRPGEPLGSRGCTWIARPVRTVEASCIEKLRFKETCGMEIGHSLYQPKSAAIIQRALASSDPRKGGCPDAKPGQRGPLEIVV